MSGITLGEIQARCAAFAAACGDDLQLYRRIAEAVASDDEVASILLSARPGQARPVLLLAALHDLVLDLGAEAPAARWYPSVGGEVGPGDPWPDVWRTFVEHTDRLRDVVSCRSTQTNEVNRVGPLAMALAAAAADRPAEPISLIEMGASAGLLLGLDRYRIELARPSGVDVLGDPSSSVRCETTVLGTDAEWALPVIEGRLGIDLDPLDVRAPSDVRWMEACVWPESPHRLARLRAAVAQLAEAPPPIVRGDMVEVLEPSLDQMDAGPASHLVVFSSWGLTYVERSRRDAVVDTLAAAARRWPAVSWVTLEPAGGVPGIEELAGVDRGTTVVGLHRWRDGERAAARTLGTAHPHGETVSWLESVPAG